MDWPCLAEHPEGVLLKLKVSPNASKNQIQGLWQDRLRVRIQAPPVEGKANAALRKWLSEIFDLRANDVVLLQGERGSIKSVLLRGLSVEEVCERLDALKRGEHS
jgi:uncharacterized protein (TIGR00251 family)